MKIKNSFRELLLNEYIYTLKLLRRGINIKAGREINILKALLDKELK